jgi:hypothetical protein
MEIPLLTLGETFMKPSTMLYRNLLAMDAEEALRAYPADGVVLLGGCDKTVPALMMGATSANLPAIFVPAGPMLRGNWRGQILGSGTDVWKYWAEKRAGLLDDCAWREIEEGIARSFGTCMTMGPRRRWRRRWMQWACRCQAHHRFRPRTRRIRAWPPPPAAASSRWCGRTCGRATS